MCGFTGFVDLTDESDERALLSNVTLMTQKLVHRGPDSEGFWQDATVGIALGHRRLSIVDLSSGGHQPMVSHSGRYVIAYNGEIYNFKKIRARLQKSGVYFESDSDTEVLLSAIEYWGLAKALAESIGMFAFALWDKHEQTLTLARDRIGEKPLYYGFHNKQFIFGSELKAFKAHPAWNAEINRDSITQLLRYNYIPAPYSIYQGIYKLPAGCTLELSDWATIKAGHPNVEPFPRCSDFNKGSIAPKYYWSFSDILARAQQNSAILSDHDAVSQLESLLKDSIDQQMFADVPVGALLSGGIDSSTIVALMQQRHRGQVHTFSIGFDEAGYNEAEYARQVAEHLGTRHTELYVSPEQALAVIPKLSNMYDEPFSDSSQIPTYLVSKLARENVTVALSGDAGDELFGGYNRYHLGQTIWSRLAWMPLVGRKALSAAITRVSADRWQQLYRRVKGVYDRDGPLMAFGDKMHKLAEVIRTPRQQELYLNLISHWKQPEELVIGGVEPHSFFSRLSDESVAQSFVGHMMHVDTLTYLPDDILAKVDRASMAVSLEMRVPFLDHRVVEFAAKLPMEQKIRSGQGKWVLRQVLNKHVPQSLIDRPKMGFGVPIDQWLRGPLRDWAESLLDSSRLGQEQYFNSAPIQKKWREHLSGDRNWQYYLWDVLMFQAWLEDNLNEN